MSALERPVLTPSQLNALARELLEGAFPLIWVEGELSGVSRPASGHLYFTLKDARAQVRCALFKPRAQWLKFRPVDGVKVQVRARLTLYEPRGDYQLIVEHMEEAGEGALLRAFEALKARLAAEGLFDAQRKQPLPRYVRRLGLVTSPSGAAVRDVLSILRRRFPLVEVEVLPVPVQGEGAAVQIAAMLQRADAAQRHDVLLLTRGGGSLEDLQAFNDEALARTIAALRTPLVSAVGHEIDTSISDLVADLRAATPSAAAELLVPDSAALATTLQRRRQVLEFAWRRSRQGLAQRLDQLQQRLQAQRPAARLQRGRERLESLRHRMNLQLRHELRARNEHRLRLLQRLLAQHPGARAGRLRERLQQLPVRQQAALRRLLERRRAELTALGRALAAVNPLATLSRGYAILRNEHGQVIRDPAQVEDGQPLQARLQHGDLTVRVEKR